MGAYKFYNPTTQKWEIIKSKSIIKDDGSLEYTPDDIKSIENDLLSHKADKVQHLSYAIAAGTNTYTATINGITALTEGMSIKVKFQNANTGTATLNINGLGAKSIRKGNGNTLSSGNIKAGQICHLVYTGSVFQLLGEGGEYGNVTPGDVIKGVTFGTEEGLKTGTLELTGNTTTADVLSGKTFYTTNPKSKQTGTMPNHSNATSGNMSSSNITDVFDFDTDGGGAYGRIKLKSPFTGYVTTGTEIIQNVYGLNPSVIKKGQSIGKSGLSVGTYTGEGNATTSQVLSGRTFSTATLSNATGTMPNRGAVTNTITTQGGSYTIPAGYHNGSGKVTANFANLVAENIREGVNIGGVVGKLVIPIPYSSVWTQRTSSFGTIVILDVAYGNNMFVAVGNSGKLATSTDGTTWTQRTSSFGTTGIQGVAYGNNMWVAVGNSGKLATSTDGITWIQRTSSFDTTRINSVAYGNNMWVAVGESGKLATSTNGTTWTQRTSSFSSTDIQGVAYGNNMWVAVGDSGKLATSTDGITWTQRTSSFDDTTIYGVAYGNNMWVAVGYNGKLAILPDGITWEQRTSSFGTTRIESVAYGNNMWVAVGYNGKLATLS